MEFSKENGYVVEDYMQYLAQILITPGRNLGELYELLNGRKVKQVTNNYSFSFTDMATQTDNRSVETFNGGISPEHPEEAKFDVVNEDDFLAAEPLSECKLPLNDFKEEKPKRSDLRSFFSRNIEVDSIKFDFLDVVYQDESRVQAKEIFCEARVTFHNWSVSGMKIASETCCIGASFIDPVLHTSSRKQPLRPYFVYSGFEFDFLEEPSKRGGMQVLMKFKGERVRKFLESKLKRPARQFLLQKVSDCDDISDINDNFPSFADKKEEKRSFWSRLFKKKGKKKVEPEIEPSTLKQDFV